ncbi:MAG: hypothetical protein IKV47_05830 [Oscillospiraceae bacterium]|nr:hypothetical protein [Oscillospiraceae bacterium]
MANHVMFRSDAMAGTTLGQYLVSLRVASEIDNGMLVAVGSLEEGQREVKAMTPITAETKLGAIAVIGSEEVDKEKSFDTVGGFTNKVGTIARGYILHDGGAYSVTAEAFEGGAPVKDAKVFAKAGSNKHFTAGDVEIGTCEAIETDGTTTWYVIRIGA